jgi:hypothetical protein
VVCYEGALNRSYDRAFKQLHMLQSARRRVQPNEPNPDPAPAPVTPTIVSPIPPPSASDTDSDDPSPSESPATPEIVKPGSNRGLQ